ncbi:MAG: hypothetical protein IAF94_07745 [Pirellulaceae bacterium]|nr:hypothetical protein [Pirellulaceae bacterium]
MSDRTLAIEILTKARTTLAERLTEQIVEQGEDLLADASGDSYMNEIEALYEQVGHKLSHISQMLANLPIEPSPTHSETAYAQHSADNTFTVATEAAPSSDAFVEQTMLAIAGPLFVATPALPSPKIANPAKERAMTSALQTFAALIQAGDLLAAGRTLAMLFELEESRAIACAAIFSQRVRSEAAFFHKIMELRGELFGNNSQRALLLLLDCFGLSRGESAEILKNLHSRKRHMYG